MGRGCTVFASAALRRKGWRIRQRTYAPVASPAARVGLVADKSLVRAIAGRLYQQPAERPEPFLRSSYAHAGDRHCLADTGHIRPVGLRRGPAQGAHLRRPRRGGHLRQAADDRLLLVARLLAPRAGCRRAQRAGSPGPRRHRLFLNRDLFLEERWELSADGTQLERRAPNNLGVYVPAEHIVAVEHYVVSDEQRQELAARQVPSPAAPRPTP